MQSLLDDGDCLPMADQEVAGGSMAAASATSISEDTDVKGSDVVSESEKKPVPDVTSESEKEPGSDLISESEKTPGDASFCTDCEWKQMGFTCGFRVKFLVDHYKVKEEEVR